MPKELLIQVAPEVAANDFLLKDHVAKMIRVTLSEVQHISIVKRSIDARQKAIKINLKLIVFFQGEPFSEQKIELPHYPNVANQKEVIISWSRSGRTFCRSSTYRIRFKTYCY
jgi:hypothetical protein